MASISPGSSPRWDSRWDNRNSGFISPSQLQLWKQHQEQQRQQLLQHSPLSGGHSQSDQEPNPSTPPPADASSQPLPAMFRTSSRPDVAATPQPSAPTHSRTSSAFSLFKSKTQHVSSPSSVSLQTRPGPSDPHNNGYGHHPSPSHASNAPMVAGSSTGGGEASRPPPQSVTPLGTPNRSSTLGSPMPAPAVPPLHPEIRSIVQLNVAHGRKVYFSGPLVRHLEREPDGQRPRKDDGWSDVWAQLGGTTLSVWDMKEIDEASKQGRQVPPSYINITDAFMQVLGSVTIPATATSPAKKYTNVLTLNTAGCNLLLFACPSTQALLSWTAALRLAAWEKSRLEEIYTAHLFRITLQDGRDAPTPLAHGRLEGWAQVRIAGLTDWRRLWMVVSAGGHVQDQSSVSSAEHRASPPTMQRKKRISSLFSRDHSPPRLAASVKPMVQMFASNKPKDKKKALLTLRDAFQSFAVYPERPELIAGSTIVKIEGMVGDEELAGPHKNREGWLMFMPEMDRNKAVEMLKWLTAIHDAFELYGRPRLYSWDPRDPRSMMFAYPIGDEKDSLFLDRELAEGLDPRDERVSAVRAQLQHILWDRMRGSPGQSQSPSNKQAPTLPPLPEMTLSQDRRNGEQQGGGSQPMQLPPLNFDTNREHELPDIPAQGSRALTPITERSDPRNSNPGSAAPTAPSSFQQQSAFPSESPANPINAHEMENGLQQSPSFFGGQISTSPPTSPGLNATQDAEFRGRQSIDSFAMSPGSRPDSKLSHFPTRQPTSPSIHDQTASTTSPSYQQQDSMGRQSPAIAFPRRNTGASISSGLQQSSRSDSPRPSRPPSVPTYQDPSVAHPPSPHFSVLTSPHSLSEIPVNAPSGRPSSPNFSVLTSPHSIPPESPPRRDPNNNRPASPHYSVLTSPHSIPDSPVRQRGSRLSIVQDAAPSARNPIPTAPASPTPTSPVTPSMSASQYTSNSGTTSTPTMAPMPASALRQQPNPASQVRAPQMRSTPSNQPPPLPSKDEPSPDLLREAGAWYYMRLEQGQAEPRRQPPPLPADDDDSSETDSAYSPTPGVTAQSSQHGWGSPSSAPIGSANSYFPPQGQLQASVAKPTGARTTVSPDSGYTPRMATPPTRKPSGARAVPASHGKMSAHRDQQPTPSLPPADIDEADEGSMSDDLNTEERGIPRLVPPRLARQEAAMHDEHGDTADALAALSFLEREEAPVQPRFTQPQSPRSPGQSPLVPQVVEPRSTSPTGSVAASIRSSFAPSKQAAQRKAKSQAQHAAQQAAVNRPGRANGRQRKMRDANAWGESSEEEEEEDEEEDEDADSDEEPRQRTMSMDKRGMGSNSQVNVGQQPTPEGSPGPNQRRPRDLPRIPGQQPQPQGSQEHLGPQRRFVSDQYPNSMYTDGPNRQSSPQYQNPAPTRPTNRWNQVLEREQPEAPARDTFVQIEPPAQTMTKAFAPHGLLSAGLQDKQDRSAKRQEELARESGASLINVPHKPPPPQTGLLGAVTAHERERKREGGLGATLTEREREKRMAEERQRKLDELQRMQLDQMQQGGSMYGGMGMAPQFTGYNPMMMGNPMMNPMMTGGWGMMNPQHMFAAQQAAQAYQQAMATFSTAGSQVGDNTGNPQPMNPMMTGMSMYGDPRMSMMGLPMMNPQMTGMGGMGAMGGMGGLSPGMSPGMGPGMGMGMGGMGMGMGMGMNPQMTGGAFDANYPPANEGGLRAPTDPDGPGSRPYSQNSSVNGQGSPAGAQRPLGGGEDPTRKAPADIR